MNRRLSVGCDGSLSVERDESSPTQVSRACLKTNRRVCVSRTRSLHPSLSRLCYIVHLSYTSQRMRKIHLGPEMGELEDGSDPAMSIAVATERADGVDLKISGLVHPAGTTVEQAETVFELVEGVVANDLNGRSDDITNLRFYVRGSFSRGSATGTSRDSPWSVLGSRVSSRDDGRGHLTCPRGRRYRG